MSTKDLIPFNKRSPEEAREIRSKGGHARKEKILEEKKIAQVAHIVLNSPIAEGKPMTKLEAIVVKIIKKLYDNPNMKDLKILCEILGQMKPTTEIEGGNITINVNSDTIKQEDLDKLL